jgi:glutaredoxin 3
MAKQYLSAKDINFKEIDITSNVEATNWVINHTGQTGVPVIDFDSQIVIGFDKAKIDSILNAK